MLTEERCVKITDLVEQYGSIGIAELMAALDASESTIRRDLMLLDERGVLVRVRGGAMSKARANGNVRGDSGVSLRKERAVPEKMAIARYAARLVQPDDFVYMDAGTTTELMCDCPLPDSAVFVTNAVSHAKRLSGRGLTVYLLGGEFKYLTEAVVGEDALAALGRFNFTKGFFGANAITVTDGFTTPEPKEAMVKQVAMERTDKPYVLADASKFGFRTAVCFGKFRDAEIITDAKADPAFTKYKNVLTAPVAEVRKKVS